MNSFLLGNNRVARNAHSSVGIGKQPLQVTKRVSDYLFPSRLETGSKARRVNLSRRTILEDFREEFGIDTEALNGRDEQKKRNGEISLDIHVGTNKLVKTKVLVGEDKLPNHHYVHSHTYSLLSSVVLIIFFPKSEVKSV